MFAIDVGRFFFRECGYVGNLSQEYLGSEEDEDSRTEIINSVSEIGLMVDFLKNNPFVTMEDYKWKLNPAMIVIMQIDYTHVSYLSDKEAKMRNSKIIDGTNLDDLGNTIFK